jgi:hypothetical protein
MKQSAGGILIAVRRPHSGASAHVSTNGSLRWRRRRAAASPPARLESYNSPIRFGGQYVANAFPMIQSRGTGPQNRLSSDAPRLSPIMK